MERNRFVVATINEALKSMEVQQQLCLVRDERTESGNFG